MKSRGNMPPRAKIFLRCLLRTVLSLLIWLLTLLVLVAIAEGIWGKDETNTINLPVGYVIPIIFVPLAAAVSIWIKPARAFLQNKRAETPKAAESIKPDTQIPSPANDEAKPSVESVESAEIATVECDPISHPQEARTAPAPVAPLPLPINAESAFDESDTRVENSTEEAEEADQAAQTPPPSPRVPDPQVITATEGDILKIIRKMEKDFDYTYRFAFDHFLNAQDCQRAFSMLCKRWDDSAYPIPLQIRLEQLKDEYRDRFQSPNPMLLVDNMNGHDFELWCAKLLLQNGFSSAEVTPGSGDQGVDVLACKDGVYYAVQCKCYHSDLGNTPVQEVYAGKEFYKCQVAAVMTNRHFTDGAKQLASYTRVLLWDREKLIEMLKAAGEKFPNPVDIIPAESADEPKFDELLPAAVDIVLETGQASVSILQRRLKLGYFRAARLADQMEELGIVAPFMGSTPRTVLIDRAKWEELKPTL